MTVIDQHEPDWSSLMRQQTQTSSKWKRSSAVACIVCWAAALSACHRSEPKPAGTPPVTTPKSSPLAVSQIEIRTSWVGLGKPASAGLKLAATGNGGFSGTWSHGEGPHFGTNGPWQRSKAAAAHAASTDLDGLVSALQRPCLTRPTLAAFGVTTDTLRAHLSLSQDALLPYFEYKAVPAAAHEIFARNFIDTAKMQSYLERILHGSHTDDFPSAQVTLSLADGTKWTATSMSQLEEMLPWEVTRPGSPPCETYDPAVPFALAKLMPEGMLNQQRLNGSSLYDALANETAFQMTESGDIKR